MGKLAQQLGGQSQVKVTEVKPAGKKVTNMKKGGMCGMKDSDKDQMKCGGKVKGKKK